jgi:serpin B
MTPEPAGRSPTKFRTYFALGALFEVLLIICAAGLPACNLAIEITNFAILVHYPLVIIMEGLQMGGGEWGGSLLLILGFLSMASLWGLVLLLVRRGVARLAARLNRRQKRIVGVIAGIGALLLLGDAVAANLPQKPIPFTSSPEIQAVVDGNNAFALDLYQQLRAQPGNVFISPFSISTALAMTRAGARGQTEKEMTNVLHLVLPQAALHPAFRALLARMDRIQRGNRIILKTANSLWGQRDYPFTADFVKMVREDYFAEAQAVDFKQSPETAANEINRWVDAQTAHKIPGGLPLGALTKNTRLVLGDAIYFKGKWQHVFKKQDTQPAPFYISTNETVTVPMMFQTAPFRHAFSGDDSVELIELPYTGQDLSMIILLPTKYGPDGDQNDVYHLEQQLTADNLRAWLGALDQAYANETRVGLPRFTTKSSFNLVNDLKALGMTSAFDGTADFSGLDGTQNLFLSDVFHNTFVEVNEAGTEAAAAALVVAATKGGPSSFVVDRPFIFLIREHGSGTILFLGRIINPAAS